MWSVELHRGSPHAEIEDPTMPPMSAPFALWGYGALLEDGGLARLVDGDLAALADFRHELGAA